jgi:hypothetical protein
MDQSYPVAAAAACACGRIAAIDMGTNRWAPVPVPVTGATATAHPVVAAPGRRAASARLYLSFWSSEKGFQPVKTQARSSRTVRVALVATLVVLLAAALAGAFAPAAAAADAATIDGFLTQHDSPMAGTGAVFVAEGQLYGVDPVFLVAIAGAETSFGKQLYSKDGDQCTFNAFNWFYGPTWPTSDFTSWDQAIARVAAGLGGSLYHEAGLVSVDAIAPRYCPDGTAQWVSNVKAFMTQLGGDPSDTRIDVAAAPAPSPTPPSSEPGLLALSGSVKLDQGDREVGQRIYAWFTLTNTGGQPLELEGIRLAIRGPGRVVRDMVSGEPLTLGAGQAIEVSSSWPLDLAGRWRGWIEVTQGDKQSLVGEKQAFGFLVRLPKHIQLDRWERRDSTLTQAL